MDPAVAETLIKLMSDSGNPNPITVDDLMTTAILEKVTV